MARNTFRPRRAGVHATQFESATSAKEEGNPENIQAQGGWELSRVSHPTPVGRQWDGNMATVYGSRKELLLGFLELSRDQDSSHICIYVLAPRVDECDRERQCCFPGQKIYN